MGGYHELTVWDITEGKLEKRIYTRAERAKALVFLPDGNLAVRTPCAESVDVIVMAAASAT